MIEVKAQEWLESGSNSTNVFDAFSNYWRGFNNLFAGRGNERDLISRFIQSNIDEEFSKYLLMAYSKEVGYLTLQPVIDMRGNGRDTSQYITAFNQAKTVVEKIVSVFMIIYQVRCNFEHGQKSPSRERDKALCNAACPIVAEVVRHAVT